MNAVLDITDREARRQIARRVLKRCKDYDATTVFEAITIARLFGTEADKKLADDAQMAMAARRDDDPRGGLVAASIVAIGAVIGIIIAAVFGASIIA